MSEQKKTVAEQVAEAEAKQAAAEAAAALDKPRKPVRLPNVFEALLPILVLLGLMICNFIFDWGLDAHMPCGIALVVAGIVGVVCGHSYKEVLAGIISAVSRTMEAILILMCVGIMVAAFTASGVIPSLIYYGLMILSPKVFLPIGMILCAIVGMSCGSSWTTTATMGIAFLGIGAGLGINPALTAGMCISGAYVGDKFSPLSDTTNLAAATGETGLFDHVGAMVSTTGPCFVIALIIYTIIGISASGAYDATVATEFQNTLAQAFNLSPLLLLPIVLIVVVCVMKMPAIPALLLSILVAVIFGALFQHIYSIGSWLDMMHYGYSLPEEYCEMNDLAAELLGSRGGMDGQMWTINLVILAVAFGGTLEKIGCVETLFGGLMRKVKKAWQMVGLTLLTSLFCDFTMCDQYLAIIVPGAMYRDKFDEMGLARNMLSRTLEDCGTLWSPMCPWNSCGVYQTSILGMGPLKYGPYAFLNIINPIYAFITALLGRNIFWGDGAYTNLLGKTHMMAKPAAAPDDAKAVATAAAEALRAEGKIPAISEK